MIDTRFRDVDLNEPPSHESDPSAVYLGSLTRNRVCWDHRGTKMKVISINTGSVTVARAGRERVINGRAFTPRQKTTLARGAVVYLRNPTRGGR